MIKVASNNSNNLSNIKNIFKGSLVAIIVSIILLFNFSAILTYTSVSEKTMSPVVIIITIISILIGSQMTTSKIRRKGIINGGLVGLIYILFLYVISSVVTGNFSITLYAVVMGTLSIIAGAIGGIIGINRKN